MIQIEIEGGHPEKTAFQELLNKHDSSMFNYQIVSSNGINGSELVTVFLSFIGGAAVGQ